jgi:hypothetical protein
MVSKDSLESAAEAIRDVYKHADLPSYPSTYKPSEFAEAIEKLKNRLDDTNILTGFSEPEDTQGVPGDLYIFYNEPPFRTIPVDDIITASFIEPAAPY